MTILDRLAFVGRIGFLGRVVLIVLLLQLALVAVTIVVDYVVDDRPRALEDRFPAPRRAGAIVALLENAAPEDRARVLRAVSTEELNVELSDLPPSDAVSGAGAPAVAWVVGQYLETLPEREIVAVVGEGIIDGPSGLRDRFLIAVALEDGGSVVFHLRGFATAFVFGVPPGFFIGISGCLFAALALWAIAREARPLRRLAEALDAFAAAGRPQPVAAQGAPEIRRLIEAVNAMQARISELLWGRTVMLGAISHDLKTYITRLRFRAEAIDDAPQRGKAVADLDEMTALIDDAIAVARGASDATRRERVDLASLLKAEESARADAELVVETAGPSAIDGDPVALRRLTANLIDNALRYGTRAATRLERRGGALRLTVDDDGPGVPEDARAKVFEPFWRAETSRSRDTGGAGLGLAIVKQIADAHNAEISIETSPLGGARFVVRFPDDA